MRLTAAVRRFAPALACACLMSAGALAADLQPDPLPVQMITLPAKPSPHWVWIGDMAFTHLPDGRAYLVDGDKGAMLGLLSTGFNYVSPLPAPDGSVIYSPETYFSRGTRGTRTELVTLYDPRTLTPIDEITIPAKRVSAIPMQGQASLTDGGRFLLIYNYTPEQSTTVVDTQSRKFVGEVDTAGCALLFPTGPRDFFSLCADGGVLSVTLDDSGHAAKLVHSRPLFELQKDPITEKPVRLGDTWYFTSYESNIYPFKTDAKGTTVGKRWSLVTDAERAAGWRTGGLQQLAMHRATRRLYAIMHQGPLPTHKDPGNEVWVYDVTSGKRLQKITLKNIASSIQVSQDDQPLLYAVFLGSSALEIYDAMTGSYLRSVSDLALTPTVLVTP